MRGATIFTVIICLVSLSLSSLRAEEANPEKIYEVTLKTVQHDGGEAVLITVIGKQGYHINIDYPWKLTVQPAEGLVLEKYRYLGADAETLAEEKAVFRIPYQVNRDMRVEANLKFAVCKEVRCVLDEVVLTWSASAGQ